MPLGDVLKPWRLAEDTLLARAAAAPAVAAMAATALGDEEFAIDFDAEAELLESLSPSACRVAASARFLFGPEGLWP